MGCTVRTVNRLIRCYKSEGKSAFRHGNRGRKPACTVSDDVRAAILCLYDTKYENANLLHFSELLEEYENIKVSDTFIRRILFEEGILSPKAHKATKKRIKEQLKKLHDNSTSNTEKNELQKKLAIDEDPHLRRPRCAYFGEMLQMDASPHNWFGGFTILIDERFSNTKN